MKGKTKEADVSKVSRDRGVSDSALKIRTLISLEEGSCHTFEMTELKGVKEVCG